MKKFDSTQRFFVLFAITAIIGSLLGQTGNIYLNVGTSFVVGLLLGFFTQGIKKYWFTDIIGTVAGCLFGLTALLF